MMLHAARSHNLPATFPAACPARVCVFFVFATLLGLSGNAQAQQPATVTIEADRSFVMEGQDATFTLTRTDSATADLPVTVRVTQTGDFIKTADSYQSLTVTFQGINLTAELTVETDNDAVDEADGSITVTVQAGTGYTLGTPQSATMAVYDDDPPQVTVSFQAPSVVYEDVGEYTITIAATTEDARVPTESFYVFIILDGNSEDVEEISERLLLFDPEDFRREGSRSVAREPYRITIVDDDLEEEGETFALSMYNASEKSFVTLPDEYVISIRDGAPPNFAPNFAPVADAGENRTIAQGEEMTLDGSESFDPEGGALSYQWTYTGERTDVTLTDASASDPTFTAPAGLTDDVVLAFNLVVADLGGLHSTPDTVEITVTSQAVRMDGTKKLTFLPKTGDEVWIAPEKTVLLRVLPEGRSAPAGLALTLPSGAFAGEEATLTFDVDPAGSAGFRLGMTVVDIDLTGGMLPAGETATVCLPAADGKAMLHRYDEETGSWQMLENSRSETRNGVAVVCAETDDFSVFGAFPPVLSEAERAAVAKAWLARFGRTVAGQAMDMIGARLARVSTGSSHLTLGGQTINLSASRRSLSANGGSGLPGADGHARWPGGHPDGWGEFRPSGRELSAGDFLLGSSFSLSATANEDGSGPRWTAWGRGATTRFGGDDGSLSVNGRVSTGTLGADYESGRLLAGLAVAHSRGEGAFDARHDKRGEMTAWLTSVYPYLRYAVHERVSVWGLLGYGRGELSLDEEEAENRIETDLAMRMGAVGVRGALLPATGGGVNLAIKSDFFMVEMESEEATELPAVEADARRVRLLLEVSRAMAMGTEEEVTPSVEVGVRYDGGDAERGSGVELGGGLRYTHLGWRLTSELTARALLAHEEKSYDEWGIGGSVRLMPDSAGRGLSFGLNSSWGASASGAEQLWAQQSAAGLAATDPTRPSGRLNAELGYGVRALDGRGLLTPYAGVTLSEGGAQASRLGTRFSLDEAFSLSLEGTRLERVDTVTEHGVLLRGVMRW